MKLPNPVSMATAACSAYQARISSLAASITPRVLLSSSGTGNYGESGKADFYTIDELPMALPKEDSSFNKEELQRVDIELGPDRQAFVIDNVLTPEESDALAACAEAILDSNGHSRVAPGIRTPPGMRINEAAHWFPPLESSSFLAAIYHRIEHLVPKSVEGPSGRQIPLYKELNGRVAHYKYNKGDQFNRHIDGLFPGQGANPEGNGVDDWTGVVSGFSLIFYLNDLEDGLEGGETRLWSRDGSVYKDITPRKGRVLAFRRGSHDAVLHAGLQVTGDVPKYMALIYLMYGERTGTRPMMH
ncbi:unnamed protein product [Cylindrotheca closterium]|uniref:Fe2OG dioxygenase domain-containing protein n=1 Tax=Cylindrotheca closterium TaxID=2856 RepID=A0AAD2JP85_9STRA|nr:unnamed protein product [Cylindrotheca closterium]